MEKRDAYAESGPGILRRGNPPVAPGDRAGTCGADAGGPDKTHSGVFIGVCQARTHSGRNSQKNSARHREWVTSIPDEPQLAALCFVERMAAFPPDSDDLGSRDGGRLWGRTGRRSCTLAMTAFGRRTARNGINAVTQARQSAVLRLVETAAPNAENGTTRVHPVRQTNEERRPREHLSRDEVLTL